jgi:Starch-binding associating with outer membrane
MLQNKIRLFGMLLAIVCATSCKKYLNDNLNPNVAHTATVQALLPTGQMYIASPLGVDLEVTGSIWGQYWTQDPGAEQYRNLEQYLPTTSTFETPWDNLYLALQNLQEMQKVAVAENKKPYVAIALLMKAYTFQLITDAWGDAPYTQALQATQGNSYPKYDVQKTIYGGMLGLVDSASTIIGSIKANDPNLPGSDDLIYAGNMAEWQKFANTLKLRMLLRLAYIDPATAATGIASLPPAGSSSYISLNTDEAQIHFYNSAGNKNPFYAEGVGLGYTQNVVASSTCINVMGAENDPRIGVFFEPTNDGTYVGIPQGQYDAVVAAGFFSIPSPYVAGDVNDPTSATAPVKFLSCYESYFLQAEAVARGWLTGASDSALYYAGIQANFEDYNTAFNASYNATSGFYGDTALSAYLAGGGQFATYPTDSSVEGKIHWIVTQKWFSMCGNQGFEAWTEWRRTGYPNFFTYSYNSLIGKQFPKRFIYPASEVTQNVNFPGLVPVTTNVWWGIR